MLVITNSLDNCVSIAYTMSRNKPQQTPEKTMIHMQTMNDLTIHLNHLSTFSMLFSSEDEIMVSCDITGDVYTVKQTSPNRFNIKRNANTLKYAKDVFNAAMRVQNTAFNNHMIDKWTYGLDSPEMQGFEIPRRVGKYLEKQGYEMRDYTHR